MKYKSIIIVTYGRSGSTLLQGILNTIPNCTIRGENHNFIYSIFQAYQQLKKAKKMESPLNPHYNTPQHSWYGASQVDLNLFLEAQKKIIKDLLIGQSSDTYYGFKEIRYINVLEDLEPFIEFLELVMEDVAIVFNIRNSKDVAQSSWWQEKDPEILIPKLDKTIQKFQELSQKKENAFCFDYDKMMQSDTIIESLFRFLEVDYQKEHITKILSKEHSNKNRKEFLPKKPLNAILFKEKSLGYQPIPKTACSSIKHALYKLDRGIGFYKEISNMNIHQYYNRQKRDIMGADFRFIIIRDPIKRFLSAYSHRVTHQKELSKSYLETKVEGQALLKKSDIVLDPSLQDFIKYFHEYYTIITIKHHTRPMVDFKIDDLSAFTHVYKMEDLASLESDISNRYKRKFTLPKLQTGGIKYKVSDLTKEELDFLFDFYKEDYELMSQYYTKEMILEEWNG
jgi:hypothetical protein